MRLRRDFEQVLTLVATHAFVHQLTRSQDSLGRVLAEERDYEAAYHLLGNVLAETLDNVTPAIRETVEAVKRLIAEGPDDNVSYTELSEDLSLVKSTISDRVRAAKRGGYLANKELRRGHPAQVVLGEPLPDPQAALPTPSDASPRRWRSTEPT